SGAMIYFCCDELRRELVRDHGVVNDVDYNGIDFLEVLDSEAPSQPERQRTLFVHFLKPLKPLSKDNFVILGGERIPAITVESISIGTAADANVLTVKVDRPGDFSTYTLRLVKDALRVAEGGGDPPDGYDPQLSSIDFRFKIECPSDFDCKKTEVCPPEE